VLLSNSGFIAKTINSYRFDGMLEFPGIVHYRTRVSSYAGQRKTEHALPSMHRMVLRSNIVVLSDEDSCILNRVVTLSGAVKVMFLSHPF
jgi:hypothetical protein